MFSLDPLIKFDVNEVELKFIKSSGPGGQNINKVSSSVQLRFSVLKSKIISPDIKSRLFSLFKNNINKDGDLILKSDKYRSQSLNKKDVIEKLIKMLHMARSKPKKRVPTKPPQSSIQNRLKSKNHRSNIKQLRKKPVF